MKIEGKKLQGGLFAIAVLLTHYSSLIFIDDLRASSPVPFWTLGIVLTQCAVAAVVLLCRESGKTVKLLSLLFILDQFTGGTTRSNHHLVLQLVAWVFLLCPSAEAIARAVRWLLVVVYLLTAFHKLNTGFFDPQISCTALFLDNGLHALFGVGASLIVKEFASFLVIFFEVVIALCLILPRWRVAAIVIAVFFHGALAMDIAKHFFDFSATMVALITLSCISSSTFKLPDSKMRIGLFLASYRSFLVLTLSAIGFATSQPWLNNQLQPELLILGAIVTLALFCLLLAFLLNSERSPTTDGDQSRSVLPEWVIAISMFILYSGPYLGIRTRYSMDMYSALQLSAKDSNHLIIPRSLDLFGYLGDWVTITSSNEPSIQEKIRLGDAHMPFLELRRLHQRYPFALISYSPDDHRILEPLTFLEKHLFVFRPNSPPGEERCRW